MLSRAVTAVDGWQRRHTVGGFLVAVAKKFGEDRASSLAALVAYYAFLSLFPLLLAFVSILGFVLQNNPSLQSQVLDSALARIPVIGVQLRDDVHPLTGSGVALALGLAGALWGGLGVTVALGRAFSEIWDVPRRDQLRGLKARARGLAVLAIVGVTFVVATAATGLVAGGGLRPAVARGGALAGALFVNAVVALTTFALLTSRPWRLRELLPGVVPAAVGALVLQSVGGWYVDRAVTGASEAYGVFALVIGLLSWFWLMSHLLLIAAEVNVVLRWRLWPRSLTGELEPGDRRALRRSAAGAALDHREQIAVTFDDD